MRRIFDGSLHKARGSTATAVHSHPEELPIPPTVQIALFGNLQVSVEGRAIPAVNTPRLHSLLAWLILEAQVPQPRERVASLLWPESSGSQSRTNLRQLLHHLKRALPEECDFLTMDRFAVSWQRSDLCDIDMVRFEAALAAAARAREKGDRACEIEALKAAAPIYVDDLLPSIYDPWLGPFREGLRNQLATALDRLASLLEEQGEVRAAIDYAEKLVAHDSLRETNYQLLFRLHVANRDRASALRTYHQLKSVLRREFGVPPGPDTLELFERVLKSDHATHSAGARPAPGRTDARPLVGRRREKQRLEATWESAVRGSHQAVIVSGEPGIGKTRLAEDLIESAERDGHAVARGRCYSGRGQVAYAPVAEWLRSEAVRSVWPGLSTSQRSELARLVPEIQEARPGSEVLLPPAESWQRVRLYEALGAAFFKGSQPIVLFLDDLQWCDADSLEWLRLLLSSPVRRGVLLLGTVRAEETGRGHPFTRFMAELRQTAPVVEIPLSPLTGEETMELARQESTEPLVEGRLEEIVQSTRGNPLFVVESVRSGLQSTRVHAVISARLANLSAASYELAGLASIVGRPFSFDLLERASDWDERSLSLALDELWQRRIIEGRGGAEYDFTHDRLRDVAKQELSPVRARYLHRRVARALAEVYRNESQEWKGQIASHYEQAGMAEQAIEHLRSAANAARQRFAYTEAAALLRRALDLCCQTLDTNRSTEQELDLLLLLGTVLVTTEGYSAPDVGRTYARALELARPLGGNRLFSSLSGQWVFHVVRGEVETSLQDAREFGERAGGDAASGLTLAANFLLGSSLFHLGQIEASRRHLTLALEAYSETSESVLEVFGGPDVRVFCRAYLSHVAWHTAPHDHDRSADLLITDAVQSADQMRHPFIQAIALTYAAMLYALKADRPSALRVGQQAVVLCRDNAFAYYLAMANVVTGWARAEQGERSAGMEQLRAGLDAMRSLGAELRLPFYYALLAEACGHAGLFPEASASLSTGFAFASKNREDWTVSELHRVQGDLMLAQGKPDAAFASYRRGLDAAQRCGSRAFERRLTELLERTLGSVPQNAFRTSTSAH